MKYSQKDELMERVRAREETAEAGGSRLPARDRKKKLYRKRTAQGSAKSAPGNADAAAAADKKKAMKKKMVYAEAKKQKEKARQEEERQRQTDAMRFEDDTRRQQETALQDDKGGEYSDLIREEVSKPHGRGAVWHADDGRKGREDISRQQKTTKKKRIYEEHERQKKTRLKFDDEPVSVHTRRNDASYARETGNAGGTLSGAVAKRIQRKAVEAVRDTVNEETDDNVGTQAVYETGHASERISGIAKGRRGEMPLRSDKDTVPGGEPSSNAPAVPDDKRPVKDIRQSDFRGGDRLYFESAATGERDEAEAQSNKAIQKKQLKRKYAENYRKGNAAGGTAVTGTGHTADTVFADVKESAGKAKEHVVRFIEEHRTAAIVLAVILMAGLIFGSVFGVFGSIADSTGRSVVQSTYLAPDEEIWAADAYYCSLEEGLQEKINNIENEYSSFDEYRYELDEITHDGFALTSYLTAKYGNYKAEDMKEEMDKLFRWQYDLRYRWEDEKRTRTETRTRLVTDPETGRLTLEEYEVEVEYTYYILIVKLTNYGLDETARRWWLYGKAKRQYGIYMATLGNRPYLFDESRIGNPAGGGPDYEVPPEAFSEASAAEIIREAEKYLGTPYVWGGYSPAGFDCSGFVSYVLNKCGYGFGHLTANGLWGVTNHISKSSAKPGDLVFFEGTYNTPGASHVGIYVGNGMMVHCGKPVQYTTIESDYWKRHLLGFGRLP